jgi:hypothetical protein
MRLFRPELKGAVDPLGRAKGGRSPYEAGRWRGDAHAVLIFKVLVDPTLYTPSDDQTEYQIRDRLSCMASWVWRCTMPFWTPRPSGWVASS